MRAGVIRHARSLSTATIPALPFPVKLMATVGTLVTCSGVPQLHSTIPLSAGAAAIGLAREAPQTHEEHRPTFPVSTHAHCHDVPGMGFTRRRVAGLVSTSRSSHLCSLQAIFCRGGTR